MPPKYRGEIYFISDSQGFSNMNGMLDEFSDYWASFFYPSKVGFQFGYSDDKKWWTLINNPPKTIGDEILKKCPNTSDLVWVDFTAYDIWPKGFTTSVSDQSNTTLPSNFNLYTNYPNPFNPSTNISFMLGKSGPINLCVFNVLGQKVKSVIDNQVLSSGTHKLQLDLSEQSSGIYFLILIQGSKTQIQKIVLIK